MEQSFAREIAKTNDSNNIQLLISYRVHHLLQGIIITRLADDQFGRQYDVMWGLDFSFNKINQQLGGYFPNSLDRMANGSKRRVRLDSDIQIIKPYDSNIIGNF